MGNMVDYAGLFPPAALPMGEAVANYAAYCGGPEAWIVGRFIVPVLRLEELEEALKPNLGQEAWELSGLFKDGAEPEIGMLVDFNKRHEGRVRIVSAETRFVGDLRKLAKALGAGIMAKEGPEPPIEVWVEVDLTDDVLAQVTAIAEAGLCAKIRTGGVTENLFPKPVDVVRFLGHCLEQKVRFKATAGLHHPIRADFPLTYEQGSPQATMYGYLNLFTATAVLRAGGTVMDAVTGLEETAIQRFSFEGDIMKWRNFTFSMEDCAALRDGAMTSFGSCSIREPLDELLALNPNWTA